MSYRIPDLPPFQPKWEWYRINWKRGGARRLPRRIKKRLKKAMARRGLFERQPSGEVWWLPGTVR